MEFCCRGGVRWTCHCYFWIAEDGKCTVFGVCVSVRFNLVVGRWNSERWIRVSFWGQFPVLEFRIGRLAFLPAEPPRKATEEFFCLCHFRRYIRKVFYSLCTGPFQEESYLAKVSSVLCPAPPLTSMALVVTLGPCRANTMPFVVAPNSQSLSRVWLSIWSCLPLWHLEHPPKSLSFTRPRLPPLWITEINAHTLTFICLSLESTS